MGERMRLGGGDLLGLLLVVAIAAGTRAWYVAQCTNGGKATPALEVQGQTPLHDSKSTNQLDALVRSLTDDNAFRCLAPLADAEETTANVAPLYPWLFANLRRLP